MAKYIGVMSGTSLDGVDVALCEIDAHCTQLLATLSYPMPQELKLEIIGAIEKPQTLKEIGELDVKLGRLFGAAVTTLMEQETLTPSNITAIGLHGQTLWHEPRSSTPFSLQLGNANEVVAQCGIDVIADFRGADIANGGEGAPFAPAFHQKLFGHLKYAGVVNIGGMANITILGDKVLGYDTGCGNVLLDGFMQRSRKEAYDKEGALAKSGKLNMALLQSMLRDAYFAKEPPKSTGREYFNLAFLDAHLQNFQGISDADIMRTLTELTATTIANEANRAQLRELIVCGGGTKNSFLMQRLDALCKASVKPSEDYGINSDFLEAMLFAWLAYKRINKESVALKRVTGAKKNAILGAHYAATH